MMLPTQFISDWGKADLFRFPSDLLNDIDISGDAKAFLLEAGLPLQAETPFGICSLPLPLSLENPPVPDVKYTLLSRSPFVTPRYRLMTVLRNLYLNRDESYDVFFAIEETIGKIWLVGPSRMTNPYQPDSFQETNRFVNSSVMQLAESLLEYRNFVKKFDPYELYREEIDRLMATLEQRWRQIDPEAMADSEYQWPMMIYSMSMHL